jgi:hypothetical protein
MIAPVNNLAKSVSSCQPPLRAIKPTYVATHRYVARKFDWFRVDDGNCVPHHQVLGPFYSRVFALRISGVASRPRACPPRYYRFRGAESKAVGCWSIKKGTCEPKSVVPNFSGCIARSSMPYADVSFKIWFWYASCFATAFIQCRMPGRGVWHPKHRWCSRSRTGPFGAMQGAPCFWMEKHHFGGKRWKGRSRKVYTEP